MIHEEGLTFYLDQSDDKSLFLHVDVVDPTKPSMYKRVDDALTALTMSLADRGIQKLFTYVGNQGQADYAYSFGFRTENKIFDDQYEVMSIECHR